MTVNDTDDRRAEMQRVKQLLGDLDPDQFAEPLQRRLSHAKGLTSSALWLVEVIENAHLQGETASIRHYPLHPVENAVSGMDPNDEFAEQHKAWTSLLRESQALADQVLHDGGQSDLLDKNADWRRIAMGISSSADTYLAAADDLLAFENNKAESANILEGLKLAAGQVGEHAMVTHYSAYAKHHLRVSNVYRCTAAVLMGVIALYAWRSEDSFTSVIDWTRLAVHAAVAFSLAAVAVYASRLAGAHRRQGDWAGSLEVQLRTLEAYLATLDPDEARQARADFARRVLGPPPQMDEGPALHLPTDGVLEVIRQVRPAK